MSISPALSSASNSYQAGPGDNGWQQFAQLVRAVNAGDLPAAQKAYTKFTESSAADVAHANPNSRIAQTLNQIGDALQSGDVAKAQQALAAMRPARVPAAEATSTQASAATSSQPDAPGAKLDVKI